MDDFEILISENVLSWNQAVSIPVLLYVIQKHVIDSDYKG